MKWSGFTLIELLVVITIIAVLAAILFPVFSRAKSAAKSTDCISRNNQLLKGTFLYVSDNDGHYPQSRKNSANPSVDDADGSLEEPDFGSIFPILKPYLGGTKVILACMEDHDPFGGTCVILNPDVPDLNSFVYNGNFAFGLTESGVERVSQTVLFSERRSDSREGVQPFCNYMYRPWFNSSNSSAPEDDMDGEVGAIATRRHNDRSNYGFVDGHVKNLAWTQTFSLSANVNLHKVN
jgi:prepilin-type N-terminal cleavage/methylation domain-containing protein/prepilin-type processing-associated H-X9-DG protein